VRTSQLPSAELAEQFGGSLWGSLMVSLLLGIAERPNSREVAAVPATPQLRFWNLIRYRLSHDCSASSSSS
jgi:hypothetical protein